MSWSFRYGREYKTWSPELFITAVCSFPNMIDTVEKARKHYRIDEVQKDHTFAQIYADFNIAHGCNFIPVALEDDLPKLAKLRELTPIAKSYFWCIAFRPSNYKVTSLHSAEITPHKHMTYKGWLDYYLIKLWKGQRGDSILKHLFEQCIQTWVYENKPDLDDNGQHRLFLMAQNSYLNFDHYESKNEDYQNYITSMYNTNWYEFIFKAYTKRR